jgi:hypothetical protein
MRAMNRQLLKELAPKEIIADKAMAISILEALWFCGQNPVVSNDQRCFPLRLLGELREYQADKIQKAQAIEAIDVLRKSDWVQVNKWLTALHQAIAGSEIFNLKELDFTKPAAPKPVEAPPAPPSEATASAAAAAGAAVAPRQASPPLSATAAAVVTAAPLQDSPPSVSPRAAASPIILINPLQLGGSGIKPILPNRSLGALRALPPLRRSALATAR